MTDSENHDHTDLPFNDLDSTAAVACLGDLLRARGLMMATAESCTGGGIAAALTDVAGSSEWFSGGAVTYSNAWKHQLLGVPLDTLAQHGAVSEETVHAMLNGLKNRLQVAVGIAVSGIAGPGGGTAEKPVGTVVVGVFAPQGRAVRTMHFSGSRADIRQSTIRHSISMLISLLKS